MTSSTQRKNAKKCDKISAGRDRMAYDSLDEEQQKIASLIFRNSYVKHILLASRRWSFFFSATPFCSEVQEQEDWCTIPWFQSNCQTQLSSILKHFQYARDVKEHQIDCEFQKQNYYYFKQFWMFVFIRYNDVILE